MSTSSFPKDGFFRFFRGRRSNQARPTSAPARRVGFAKLGWTTIVMHVAVQSPYCRARVVILVMDTHEVS